MKPQRLNEEDIMEDITRAELNAKFAEVDAKLAEVNTKIDVKIDAAVHMLRTEMERNSNTVIRWVIGLVFGGIILQVTLMTFVLNNAVPQSPPAAAAPPAPVVIYLPQPQPQPAPALK
jgi:hypothetical protein